MKQEKHGEINTETCNQGPDESINNSLYLFTDTNTAGHWDSFFLSTDKVSGDFFNECIPDSHDD